MIGITNAGKTGGGGAAGGFLILATVDFAATVTLLKDGTTVESKWADKMAAFSVSETGSYTIEATQNESTVSESVTVDSETAFYMPELYFVSKTLNDNSWETIQSVSDTGNGANYWSVGDRKAVAISGTVGALSISGTYYAFILGFNHNASYEGSNRIHFQFAKTAVTGGTDIAFADSSYNSTGSAAAFRMNTTNTNSGGWESSYMRETICPAFLSALPDELQNVIKTVTKYTDNTGAGGGSVESYVTATSDKIFLLSEYEVFGSRSYANSYEAAKQAQYDYYKAGNSKIKYKHSATGTAVYWWLRSPFAGNSSNFVYVYASGSVYDYNANYSLAFAPGFCA